MQADFEVEVEWRGFELHPETPVGGLSVEELLGPERAAAAGPYMKRFARGFGVDIGDPIHVSNTRRVLAMTEYARDKDRLEAFRDAAMEAHWLHGKNLESDRDLRALATRVGLDPDEALAAADDETYHRRIDAIRDEAGQQRINAIPTLLIGDFRVVGCQSYERVDKIAEQAGLTRR